MPYGQPPENIAVGVIVDVLCRQVGRWAFEGRGRRTVAAACGAVTGGAVRAEHGFALSHHGSVRRRRIRQVGGRIGVDEHHAQAQRRAAGEQRQAAGSGPQRQPAALAGPQGEGSQGAKQHTEHERGEVQR